jgi:hypothetical protein
MTMTTVPIREIENTWITLNDGTRLAARLWLPANAEHVPVPAILEFLPYRKNEGTALRDSAMHPYVAGHGYACVRVDMRGSGDSDGLLYDEYLQQELDDAVEVIAWLAGQPWCSGSVGMMGISWGGFNALQVAALRPPALKAIITLCSTDDRYADDVHYMGGCIDYDMLPWASAMLAYNACPPDPRFVGERWREMWLQRLEHERPWIDTWLAHQTRDAYWRHGSVCEDYSAIQCAVYAVGGWADGYSNAVPRLLEHLRAPRRGLIGPWAHSFPHTGEPGPAIGFLQESVRWWDHWLKGIDTGMMTEPMLRAWVQESAPPQTYYAERAGHWLYADEWPPKHVAELRSPLGPVESAPRQISTDLFHGLDSGVWCGYGYAGEWPAEQSGDDGRALCFDLPPNSADTSLCGFPEISVMLAADQVTALLAARLCAVSPTGESLLVSWGLLNLTHREDHDAPKPLVPGKAYRVTLRMNAIAQTLPAGHHWRVVLAPAYWPQAWPSPITTTLTVWPGQSELRLPQWSGAQSQRPARPFDAPAMAEKLDVQVLRPERCARTWTLDRVSNTATLDVLFDYGDTRFVDSGLRYDEVARDRYSITRGDPLSAHVTCSRSLRLGGDGWAVRIETQSSLQCDGAHFYSKNLIQAFDESGTEQRTVFERTFERMIPRRSV